MYHRTYEFLVIRLNKAVSGRYKQLSLATILFIFKVGVWIFLGKYIPLPANSEILQ